MIKLLPFLLIHLLILSQLTFTAWPEMLSYPYLLTNGFNYNDAAVPYPIGLIAILAVVYKLFGFTPLVLKIFTWIFILVLDVILFLIFRKLTGEYKLVVIFMMIYITVQSVLDGNLMWFDNATVLPLALVFYFSLIWLKTHIHKYLFFIGITLAVAIMIKQIAIVYAVGFILFYLIIMKGKFKDLKYLVLGSLIIFTPFIFYLTVSNSLLSFLLWNLYYPLIFWSQTPGYVRYGLSWSELLVLIFLLVPFLSISLQIKKIFANKALLLTIIFLISALVAVYPRFSYYHLQPALLFLVVLYLQIASRISKQKKTFIVLSLFIALTIFIFLGSRSLGGPTRFYSSDEQALVEKIKTEVKGEEKVFLLGLNSSQYTLSGKLPPKPWVDNFSWYFEIPGVQKKVINGIKNDNVKVIFRKIPQQGEWYQLEVYQPREVVDFIKKSYKKKETIDGKIELWVRN